MRIFATSDLHIDFAENRHWVENLSDQDYREDILVLAGDIAEELRDVVWTFRHLRQRFAAVCFVCGNHDLWVRRDIGLTSLQKHMLITSLAADYGITTTPCAHGGVGLVPLQGWYDFSFGEPQPPLRNLWGDFFRCRWPETFTDSAITAYFSAFNEKLQVPDCERLITFSHFLPRIDVMPHFIPHDRRFVYPVLGSSRLEQQLRALRPAMHLYGHSHVNQAVKIDGILYINNAYGYPHERSICAKKLLEI